MTNEISNSESGTNDAWAVHLQQWRARLKVSASSLCQLSQQLQEAINDERRFAILTDLQPSNDQDKEIVAQYIEFNRLLKEALAALIDLSAYNNPEQEYPDLTKWFEFKCPNVQFGRTTMPIIIL